MLKETALANTVAVVTGVFYIICAFISALAPDLLRLISQSWIHSFDLSKIPSGSGNMGLYAFGFISLVGISWATAYFFAFLYNKLK